MDAAGRNVALEVGILAAETEGDRSQNMFVLVDVSRSFGFGVESEGEVTEVFCDGVSAFGEVGLQFLSVSADPERNQALTGGQEGMFQNAGVALGVVASGEEVMIALETERILGGS